MSQFQFANNEFSLTQFFRSKACPQSEITDSYKPKLKAKAGPKKRSSPVSLRLSDDEKTRLKDEAGDMSTNAYIRARLFEPEFAPRKTLGTTTVKDRKALAQVLSALGRSAFVADLETLNWAMDAGTVSLGPSSEAALVQACADIAAMRKDLMTALGLRGD